MPPYINVKPLRQTHSDIIVNGADGYWKREREREKSSIQHSIQSCTLFEKVHAYSTRARIKLSVGELSIVSTVPVIPSYGQVMGMNNLFALYVRETTCEALGEAEEREKEKRNSGSFNTARSKCLSVLSRLNSNLFRGKRYSQRYSWNGHYETRYRCG